MKKALCDGQITQNLGGYGALGCEVSLCTIGVGKEGFAKNQKLSGSVVAVGIGTITQGLRQTDIPPIDCRI